MKKSLLFFLFLLLTVDLIAGELVPLQQYRKLDRRINPIPDRYLFEATAILTALEFFQVDEKDFRNRFRQLPMAEQYHVAYVLSVLNDDDRMSEIFIPVYNAVRWRFKETDFNAGLNERFALVWRIFLQDLRNDSDKTDEFYEYACRKVVSCRSDAPENEQLYFAQMFSVASFKMLEHSGAEQKDDIIKFMMNIINRTTSNQVKTRLTYDFIRYMKKSQLEALNTTEYALLLALPKVLYYGRFPDFSGIYHELLQRRKEDILPNEILEELHRYFPGEKWKSLLEAVEFIEKKRDSFVFIEKNRWYIQK